MKRFSLIVLAIIFSLNAYCQKSEKFKTGVGITENNFSEEIKESGSILFIFEVNGCEANFYNDLTKHIKKRFRKSKKKVAFNYNINTIVETEKIPKKRKSLKDFELICRISVDNFKGWDNHLHEKRKQNYDLVFTLEKNESDLTQGVATINVNSYWTIVTQNRNTSKLIYELFNDE